MASDRLTRALGWASMGLGLPEVLVPREVSRLVGAGDLPRHRAVTVAAGLRELTAAAGLLSRESPGWLWARVAGDVMDLGLLGGVLRQSDGRRKGRAVAATAAVAAVMGLDLYAAVTRSRGKGAIGLTASVTVLKSRQDVYERWRRLENLPNFLAHVDHVRVQEPAMSHWRVSAPFGRTVEWDAEITEDIPGERIAWRSCGGAAIRNEGDIRFTPAPGDRGTEVHVTLRYWLPAGKFAEAAARYFGEEPHQQLDDDLRRFKQVVETGEVVRSEGAPGGKRARREFPQHPARPLTPRELAQEVGA